MNDSIEKLFAQALEEFKAENKYATVVVPDPIQRDFVEKFAKLIVRECMNICAEREEDIRTRIKDEGKAATAYMIRAYIKEHFGVEE